MEKEEKDKDSLLVQHHQFIEDKSIDRDNALNKEIKEMYCDNLALRRQTALLLAAQNGILAAQLLNLPLCDRVKPMGNYFIIQKMLQ